MNRKNEKGFALVLSLVLLMAMSLMGGALIVISARDHQSNNVSDEYQQTFYVARATFKSILGPDPDTPLSTSKVQVNETKSYYDFLGSSVIEAGLNNREKKRMEKFQFQYFLTRIGSAPFKGYGTSIKKDATDAGNDGMAYRIYGCGNFDNGTIIVPLESTLVLPK